ncbi:DUF1876 domain-containing protein [Kribbella sp. NBC_01245]|uniref:dsRBD fold-containing protein n=1 Tax=Kribbella sp. NBC_01245 TaxID=2903578 RepID=UPI002E2A5FF8|nr:dsRBD fold-containing protein [Kribbella sp. NBC_01245]
MTATRQWKVDIFIDEHEDQRFTRAEARLQTNDPTHLVGHGEAHRHPRDVEVAEIGDELAAARALANLSHLLVDAATKNIEAIASRRTAPRP